ncbi:trimethyllysine dioxygenase [Cryptococcus sp. DSM 104549]
MLRRAILANPRIVTVSQRIVLSRPTAPPRRHFTASPAVARQALGSSINSGRPSHLPTVTTDETTTTIAWPNGIETHYDNYFLFDHCRCPKCFHSQTKQRLKTLSEIPADIHPLSAEIKSTGLHITWSTPTPHESVFPTSFLKKAAYDPPLLPYKGAEDTHAAIMDEDQAHSERGILKLLNKVHDFGFCFVTDVPQTAEDTKKLIEHVAPIRHTHYGGFWSFTSDLSHGDLAYSTEGLPAHTDNTYFTDPAGLQIFHLLSHPSPPGTGGTTLLVDAFYTASLLSALYPTSYSLLSRLRVPCHASGTPGTLLRPEISQPVFRHNEHGQLTQARWNNEDRGVLGVSWTPEELRGWYQAARRFEDLNRSEDAEYWVQLGPGTVLVIDNWRVMHGRSAFTGARTMCGAYVGADDWHSRRAVLAKKHEGRKRDDMDETWGVGW